MPPTEAQSRLSPRLRTRLLVSSGSSATALRVSSSVWQATQAVSSMGSGVGSSVVWCGRGFGGRLGGWWLGGRLGGRWFCGRLGGSVGAVVGSTRRPRSAVGSYGARRSARHSRQRPGQAGARATRPAGRSSTLSPITSLFCSFGSSPSMFSGYAVASMIRSGYSGSAWATGSHADAGLASGWVQAPPCTHPIQSRNTKELTPLCAGAGTGLPQRSACQSPPG